MNTIDYYGLVAVAPLGLRTPQLLTSDTEAMMLQIADVAPDVEGGLTPNGRAPNDLVQVLATTTACSSTVFRGLLAWASLNAHLASKAEITTVVGQRDTGPHS